MLLNDDTLRFTPLPLKSENDVSQVEDMVSQQNTYPYFNASGLLYRYQPAVGDKDAFIIPLGFACEISRQLQDVCSGELSIEFTFMKNGECFSKIFPREALVFARIQHYLIEIGYSYNPELVNDICRYLMLSEQFAPLEYLHTKVGLLTFQDKKCFALDSMIGGIKSTYQGHMGLKPSGSYQAWLSLIQEDIVGRPGLEFALCTALAAPVINLLPEENQGECIFVNFNALSSSGKSTALAVGASAFGNPSIKGGRLVNSWRATDGALTQLLQTNTGVPVFFDEYGLRENSKSIDFLYLFSQGRDKERMKPSGGLRENTPFCTTIQSSSEISVFSKAQSVKEGQLVRCIEIGSAFHCTDSREHADRIKHTVLTNYGHAARPFVEYLLAHEQELSGMYSSTYQAFQTVLKTEEPLELRVAKRYAMIFLAGKLANAVFGLKIDIDRLMSLSAVNIRDNMRNKSEFDLAYEYLLQYAFIHQSKFPEKPNGDKDIYGTLKENELAIISTQYEDAMKEAGFDWEKIIRLLKINGVLDYEDGKNYRKRKFGSKAAMKCYVIKLEAIKTDDEEDTDSSPKKYEIRRGTEPLPDDGEELTIDDVLND